MKQLKIALICAVVLASCTKKDVVVNNPSPYTIGQYLNHGAVFYIDPTGQHGLLCSVLNVSSGLRWADTEFPFITDTSFGSGLSNSYAILSVNKNNDCAAFQCQYWSAGAYNDWYLPSKKELNELYNVHNQISQFDSSKTNLYWSSSRVGISGKLAWAQNFKTGECVKSDILTENVAATMAVRKF
jgi:hypothetical protein